MLLYYYCYIIILILLLKLLLFALSIYKIISRDGVLMYVAMTIYVFFLLSSPHVLKDLIMSMLGDLMVCLGRTFREVGSTSSNPLNCEMMNPIDERIQGSRGRITPWSF